MSKARLEVQALEFHVTINQDCIATEKIYTKKPNFWLVLLVHLAHFRFCKSLLLYEHLSKQFKKLLHQRSSKKKTKNKTLTAIITFELSYFNCDLQISMRDEGAEKDIDNKLPPIPSLKL